MSRRPKLSLSPEVNVAKKQATGFGVATPSSGHAEAKPNTTYGFMGGVDAAPFPGGNDKTIPQPTTWPGRGRIFKVVLVVVAAALSLYLLKRRLF